MSATRRLTLLRDYKRLSHGRWRVIPKGGGIIPFKFNGAQRKIHAAAEKMLATGRQLHMKILKYRQGGVSTYCAGRVQSACQSHWGFGGLSIADKKDLPAQWLRRGRRWYYETPPALRPALEASNANELYFEEIGSRYTIASQEGQTPGMGYTIRGLHCSEMGDWTNPKKVLDDLLPAIPKNDAEGFVIYEGTGQAVGGWWYDSWELSKKGEDDFATVFLPWFLQEDYRMDPKEVLDLDQEEQHLVTAFDLDRDQLAWRRWAIRNEFEADIDRFRCKYPATEAEAWIDVGQLAIRPEILRHHAELVKEPLRRVRLHWAGDKEHVLAEPVGLDYRGPAWDIWEEPNNLFDYAVGGDVMEGVLADQDDPRSELDWSTGAVLNRWEYRFAASMRWRGDPDKHGDELEKCATWYNAAWASPEINSPGWATLTAMRDYPHLFQREGPPDALAGELPLKAYGWKTTPMNRDQLIDDWIAGCRPEEHTGFEGKIEVYDAGLLDEERNFVKKKSGKREHRPGKHDCKLFGHMIALQVHQRCPRGETESDRDAQHTLEMRARRGIEYSGGFDTWDPAEDD